MEDDESRWRDLLHCSFCGRSQRQCAKLIAGPGVYICDGCVDLARAWPGIDDEDRACSFCGARRAAVTGLFAQGPKAEVCICDDCLDLCEEIIAEERAG